MAVTADDVQRVARKYINPDTLQVVAVGDGATVGAAVALGAAVGAATVVGSGYAGTVCATRTVNLNSSSVSPLSSSETECHFTV